MKLSPASRPVKRRRHDEVAELFPPNIGCWTGHDDAGDHYDGGFWKNYSRWSGSDGRWSAGILPLHTLRWWGFHDIRGYDFSL